MSTSLHTNTQIQILNFTVQKYTMTSVAQKYWNSTGSFREKYVGQNILRKYFCRIFCNQRTNHLKRQFFSQISTRNLLKIHERYFFGVNNEFRKRFVRSSHQQIFTVAKLKLLVPGGHLPDENDKCARWRPERVQVTLKHFPREWYIFLSHVKVHSGAFLRTHLAKTNPNWRKSSWTAHDTQGMSTTPWITLASLSGSESRSKRDPKGQDNRCI